MICVLIYLWRTPFPEIMQLRNDIPDGRVGYSSGPDAFSLEDRLNQKYLQPHEAEGVSCGLGGFCKSESEVDEDVASREARR